MLRVSVCCAVVFVPCSLVVTYWESVDLLTVMFDVFCHFFPKCVLVLITINGEVGLSPPVKYNTDRSKAVLLLWIIYVFFCLVFAVPLCASVYMCLVVTRWKKAYLVALICSV